MSILQLQDVTEVFVFELSLVHHSGLVRAFSICKTVLASPPHIHEDQVSFSLYVSNTMSFGIRASEDAPSNNR